MSNISQPRNNSTAANPPIRNSSTNNSTQAASNLHTNRTHPTQASSSSTTNSKIKQDNLPSQLNLSSGIGKNLNILA